MCRPDVAGGQFRAQLDVTSEKEGKDWYMVGAQFMLAMPQIPSGDLVPTRAQSGVINLG